MNGNLNGLRCIFDIGRVAATLVTYMDFSFNQALRRKFIIPNTQCL